ncbi:hypothetical protein ACFL6N_06505 [Thermodesulfobacteriota bacterium]
MLRFLPWKGRLGLAFLLLAILFNVVHYLVFKDTDYIFKFILAQLGFLPISAYLVTVIISQLLVKREKQAMLKKLNMVIGSFFSQVGLALLGIISQGAEGHSSRWKFIRISGEWKGGDYAHALKELETCDLNLDGSSIDWNELQTFLVREKGFLLNLLGNPNLLEHEAFTELLWAVFHLTEELEHRRNLKTAPKTDIDHLTGDLKRVSGLLLGQWLNYMQHLQKAYPFLFSLAVRLNPFDPEAQPEISG